MNTSGKKEEACVFNAIQQVPLFAFKNDQQAQPRPFPCEKERGFD